MIELENFAVKRAMTRVIDERTHYGFTGHPRVKEFEAKLSRFLGGATVVGVNSGTDALILALKLLGIGKGDEVIVPAFSFISTASAVGWIEATPVFVDIRPEDYAIDHLKIEEKITPRTKAIIAVHLFGHPALEIAAIADIAKKRNLFLIEDTAQSFGSKIKIGEEWTNVGTIGDIGCLSFSSTKPFSTPGNGGAVILKNQNLRDVAQKMRYYGAEKPYFEYPVIGINTKLHEVQAAALIAKLNFFDYWRNHRKKLASLYKQELAGVGDLILPPENDKVERTWYRYVIRTGHRDTLFNHLRGKLEGSRDLMPTVNYPVPLPYFSAFANLGHKPGDFPVSDRLSQEGISLPITNYVSEKGVSSISELIRKFFKN